MKMSLNVSDNGPPIAHDKHIKKDIVANMESLAYSVSKQVDLSQLENFHEFLSG